MTPFYADPLVTLYLGDCLEVMAALPAESVDAVVTDPPYGLEFMGKAWDSPLRNGWQAEPGRYHNDTNFLASGDRIRYKAGPSFQAWCQQWGTEALRVTKPGGYLLAFGGTRTHHRLVCGLEDAGWIIRDELDWIYASGFPKGKANLKPAHEPIVLARKPGPLRPLGIDASRIGTADGHGGGAKATSGFADGYEKGDGFAASQVGRWPSNVLLSDPELFDEPNPEVVGSGATSDGQHAQQKLTATDSSTFGGVTRPGDEYGYGDSGGYSRFFIVPKSPRHERNRGLTERSSHPTVKPIDLMRHLVRLVTPPGGVILDPFAGSGTTGLATSELGVKCILIEREREYCDIIVGRLMATPLGLGLFEGGDHEAA